MLLAWETDQKVRTLRTSRQWNPSTPTGATHRAGVAPSEGRRGTACAKIEGLESAGKGRACWMQDVGELRSGAYQFRLCYRTGRQDQQGRARLVIDCYLGDARKYHGLISRDLAPAETWSEVSVRLDLPPDVRKVRILLYQVGAGTAWFDDVQWSAAGSEANLLGDGSFDGQSSFRVFYRRAGETAWHAVEAVVLERFHNVIFLEPQTSYEFKVQRVAANKKIEAESQVLTAATRRDASRAWRSALGRGRSHAHAAGRLPVHREPGGQALLRREPRRIAVAERAGRPAQGALDQGVGEALSDRRQTVLPGAESGGGSGRQALRLLEAGLSRRLPRTPASAWLRTIRPPGRSASRW